MKIGFAPFYELPFRTRERHLLKTGVFIFKKSTLLGQEYSSPNQYILDKMAILQYDTI